MGNPLVVDFDLARMSNRLGGFDGPETSRKIFNKCLTNLFVSLIRSQVGGRALVCCNLSRPAFTGEPKIAEPYKHDGLA
jgi:hypothetical protein